MTMKKLLLTALMMIELTGCLSTTYHFSGENEYPYNATVDSFNWCICVWGNKPASKMENAIDAYTKMVYPFWVLDFPFEVVMDTLLLPLDGVEAALK